MKAGMSGALALCLLLCMVKHCLSIACSPYVYPCHCGLCPNIVNCETKQVAECFCGRDGVKPGVYPHPSDKSKFWMCSYDASNKIKYGVEVTCPYRLLWDDVVKVCTFPLAVTQQQHNTTQLKAVKRPQVASEKALVPTYDGAKADDQRPPTANVSKDVPTKKP